MIYGVSIFLNDVNFSLKDKAKQVQTRISEEAFFTNRAKATSFYIYHKEQWKSQKGVTYRGFDQRGRCEMYKANVSSGQVMNHGITVYKETI